MKWMQRIIVKMNTDRAITIAGILLFVVTPSRFAVLHAAEETPPRHDADNPRPGAPIDAEKLRRLAWGPPATNGLRAACHFEPTNEAAERIKSLERSAPKMIEYKPNVSARSLPVGRQASKLSGVERAW
jgi:hypothetical protein